jgi:ligand-binding sensor domain-containing protein
MLGRFAWGIAGRTAVGLRLCFGFLWLVAHATVWSQTPAEGTDWVVDIWQMDAGLPHNSVTCLIQTKDGYLWIGTAGGLARAGVKVFL